MTGQTFGAVDIGTNSFHLLIAKMDEGRRRTVDRVKERVALGEGLGEDRVLSGEALERAYDCLERFAARIESIPKANVRAVATSAMRVAKNGPKIRSIFEKHLGHSIDIIDGIEEARLVFHGAAAVRPVEGRRLIVDIGGGSTELASGGAEPDHLDSLHVGCIKFTSGFFPDGVVNEDRFRGAIYAGRLEFESTKRRLAETAFDEVLGTSGTARALADCAHALGHTELGKDALEDIRGRCIKAGQIAKIDLPNVSDRRRPVIVGGLAILSAFVDVFDCVVEPCDGALRDGVLWELSTDSGGGKVRRTGVQGLALRFGADSQQSSRVWTCAQGLFNQVKSAWDLEDSEFELLEEACLLHEVGLAVRYAGYHKHGSYLTEKANLPGTSTRRQAVLAAMVLCHRRKFRYKSFSFLDKPQRTRAIRSTILLRLAVRLSRTRTEAPQTEISVDDDQIKLKVQGLDPLAAADLLHEVERLDSAGYRLSFS